jgi:hypothetical protein
VATLWPFLLCLAVQDAGAPRMMAADAQPEKKWRFDAALYFWMADLEGDFNIKGFEAEATADFSDLFDHLEMALTLHGEAWHENKVGILLDVNFMSFEEDRERVTGDTTTEVDMLITEVAAGFRLQQHDQVFLDVITGLRWIGLDTSVEGANFERESEDRSLLDPLIGARVGWEPVDWLLLTLRVDVGGFGVGSDISGNFATYASWRVSQTFAVVLGYRILSLQVEDDDSDIRLTMRGPVIAVDVGF